MPSPTRTLSLSHQITGDVPGRSPPRSAMAAAGPILVETCTSHSRTTVGAALSSTKCTFGRQGAPAPAAGWPAAPLPEVRGGAGCQNLPQRPRSRRSAREESLIFRAFLRDRSRRGAPLWQIWTRPRPGPPQEPHQHHHAPAHPSCRADSDLRTRTHGPPFLARKAQCELSSTKSISARMM